MATDRCVELLLTSSDFKVLPREDQAKRLATFLSVWFQPDHSLHTVDGVRLSQRIRAYAANLVGGSGSSVGAVMIDLLVKARSIHEQARPATHPEPVEESVVESDAEPEIKSVTRAPRARSKSKIKSTVAR